MGIIIAKFRKQQTTVQILEEIDKEISKLQRFKRHNQDLQKKFVASLILYSIVLYIAGAVVFYFWYFPSTWRERFLYSLPLLAFPFIVWGVKKLSHWYFIKRIASNDMSLRDLHDKKKQILEDVMEKETYKKAREILEKFDPARFKQLEKPATPVALPSAASGSFLRQRVSPGTPAALRPTTRSPSMTTPQTPRLRPPANGQYMSGYGRPPGPPLPRPILPRELSKFDKFVEYIVGDGPQNRYALICRICHSHNGMALKEEFEFLSFRCCYCYSMNHARKQRPLAPRLPTIALTPPKQGQLSNDEEEDDEYDEEDDEDEDSEESGTSGEKTSEASQPKSNIPEIKSKREDRDRSSPSTAAAKPVTIIQENDLKFADTDSSAGDAQAGETTASKVLEDHNKITTLKSEVRTE